MSDMPLASVFDACSSTLLHYDILWDKKKPGGLQKQPLDMQRCRNGVHFSDYNKNLKINYWQIHLNFKELKTFHSPLPRFGLKQKTSSSGRVIFFEFCLSVNFIYIFLLLNMSFFRRKCTDFGITMYIEIITETVLILLINMFNLKYIK